MLRFARSAGLAFTLSTGALTNATAQTPQLVFTAAAPERTSPKPVLQASAVVEERGLALWSGTRSDFGVGVALASPRWTIRSISSMTSLPVESHARPTFQQIEIMRPMFAAGSLSVAAGGGLRQEWDGTRVLIARVVAGAGVGRGRLQGGVVMERATGSPVSHDAGDLVTTLGWSRRLGGRMSLGIEGIGQDLEGLWNRAELEGGAKLLVGPSLHAESKNGTWATSLTAGPVMHAATTPLPDVAATYPTVGRRFGIFASANWVPSLRH